MTRLASGAWDAPERDGAVEARRPPNLRPASVDDAAAIWRHVAGSPVLDTNSPYAYLLLCDLFRDTCVVAERTGDIVGFVAAVRPPRRPDTVFVWQIGVAEAERGSGLGGRLLDALLGLAGCTGVRYLEATVTPSNDASQALFRSLARRRRVDCEVRSHYPEELFPRQPGASHEAEDLFRIGPFEVPTNPNGQGAEE